MKFKQSLIALIVLLSIGVSTPIWAQVAGGRKREHRNQRSSGKFSFKRNKSGGHADAFARGGHKKGFLARIFKGKKDGGAWVYKRTNPGAKQNREQPNLFSRNRTKNKRYRDGILAQQNKNRERSRGSNFTKKKR